MKLRLTISLLFAVASLPTYSQAQWQPDGVPIAVTVGDQQAPAITADGNGGAIFAWQDTRVIGGADIYAQRVNAAGVVQWTTDGAVICNAALAQTAPYILSDGSGGAFIVWEDARGATVDLYAQRVNSAGVIQWATNGVPVCTATGAQFPWGIVSDGAGGFIVVFEDNRSSSLDIYAQRVNSAGVTLWTSTGLPVCLNAFQQSSPSIVSDGAGGAIVAWQDGRDSIYDIYAQRVNSAGVVQWTPDGVAVSSAASNQIAPRIASDAAGGAIIVWPDLRNGATYDLYAQRVNAAGVMQWTVNGAPICAAPADQQNPSILADGSGGAFISWHDLRSGTYDVYAQRVNSSGAPQWTLDGVALCTAASGQVAPQIASDGASGAIVAWEDGRNGVTSDCYAQRVSGAGNVQWATNGVVLSAAAGDEHGNAIVTDGAGGAITVFYDLRSSTGTFDVYAQRVDAMYGYWGHPEPIVTSVRDIKHDQGGKVAVNWTASGRDLQVPATIDFYSVWRAVDVSPFAVSGAAAAKDLVEPGEIRADTPPGKRTKIQTSSYYWELVGTQTAYRLKSYSLSADTRSDSIAGSAGNEVFMVMAHDRTDPHIAFASNSLCGHSVDNLAPTPPLLLTAERTGNYVYLKWNGVHVRDLRDYAVYRKTSTGVTPIPVNFLSSATDTVLTDTNPPASAVYYIVTAYDVHANQSNPSNEAAVVPASSVGNLPPITALTVLQNRPNPFTTSTALEVGLPGASKISLQVYDVAGRRVRDVEMSGVKGWQQVPLSARDDRGQALASGVYFYRVHAAGTTITRKMVIAR